MTDLRHTKLDSTNPHRSPNKVPCLTPEPLDIPEGESGASNETKKWKILEESAIEMAENRKIGVAVRAVDGNIATGIFLKEGTSHEVHALELAVWKAFSESSAPITEIVNVSDGNNWVPCGRCLQVAAGFSSQKPLIRITNREGVKSAVFRLSEIFDL